MAKRGPKPFATTPLPVRNRDAQNKYYHKKTDADHPQSWFVQRKRVYKRIRDTGKLPQARTIAKYGVEIVDGKVLVPKDLNKPKVVVDWVPATNPVVRLHMDEPSPTVHPIEEGTITLTTSSDYLDKHYKLAADVNSGEKRTSGKSWKAKYRGLGAWFKKSGLMKNPDTADFAAILRDPDKIIAALKKTIASVGNNKGKLLLPGSMLEKINIILRHLDGNPHLMSQVTPAGSIPYREFGLELKKQATQLTIDRKNNRSVYNWDKVMNSIENTYGKYSLENVFARLFNEVPVRNDLHGIPFLDANKVKTAKPDTNYVVNSKKSIVVHVGDFKTDGGLKATDYKLSPELVGIIHKNLKERDEAYKFSIVPFKPGESSWKWFQLALEKAGYPNYPYGESHPKQDTMNGTRHAIATYRNSRLNLDKDEPDISGSDLADAMQHTLDTSDRVYRNLNIFDETDYRPVLVIPEGEPRYVKVKEGKKFYVGRVMNQLKNKKWVVDFGDGEREGEYTNAKLKQFIYDPEEEPELGVQT